ncbi:MAG: isoprenylcysteine carboxylmethyltransferase family protein [Acetobacteraceae bacterium]|nr:isoprenylcysteine carboxylmethyltransferase family protein [Acetobacteraceae bacterium]
MSPEDRSLLSRLVRGIALVVLLFGVPLFAGAGTLAWPEAWLLVALHALASIALTVRLWRHDPALLAERMKPLSQPDQPAWDRHLLRVFMGVFLVWLVAMGADAERFGWSRVPVAVEAGGAALQIAAYAIIDQTMRANTFLAPVVKIQRERGHRVISTGPYAIVRHPMYAGAVLLFVGMPLLLGSWWGLIGAAVMIAMLAVRCVREETVLRRDLPGYEDYIARVRYRFVPGIW